MALAVAGPLVLYVVTLPRTVVLEDDGWFLMVGKFLGVGHPPGYPVHTLLLNLILKVPWGSAAFLGHLLSAILGALACGAVYVCGRLLGAGPVPALVGAWLLAASEHFWAQAIITEVYTLHALCFFSVFALLLHLRRNPGDNRAWSAAAFLCGIGLANHWPLMVLASPGLVLAAAPLWRDFLTRLRLILASFVPAVVVPYGWMVWRSLQEPSFSFLGPLGSVDDVVGHITRRIYSDVDASVSAGWSDKFEFLGWFGGDIVWQLTLPGFLLALVGLVVLLAPRQGSEHGSAPAIGALDWAARLASPVAFLGSSVLLVWLLNFDFDFYNVQVFRPYPVVSYGLLAVWSAVGLHHAVCWAVSRARWSALSTSVPTSAIAVAAGVMLAGWSVWSHWDLNDRSGSDFARRYTDMVFDIVPPSAVLLTYGDEATLPLGYYRFVEEQRPDVRLVEMQGLLFPDNLYLPATDVTEKQQQQALQGFMAETDRPVFQTFRTHAIDHGRAVRDYGFLREVRDGDASVDTIELRPNEAAEAYFASLFEQEYHDGWERVIRARRVIDYAQYLGYAVLGGDPDLLDRTAPLRRLAETDYYGLNGMASVLARLGDAEQLEQAMAWLQTAESMSDAALTKQAETELYNNMGTVLWRQDQADAAIAQFEKSRDVWPHPDNLGVQYLQQLGR